MIKRSRGVLQKATTSSDIYNAYLSRNYIIDTRDTLVNSYKVLDPKSNGEMYNNCTGRSLRVVPKGAVVVPREYFFDVLKLGYRPTTIHKTVFRDLLKYYSMDLEIPDSKSKPK